MTFKTVRLAALRDTPTAFASTYAQESQLSDEQWVQRSIERGSGERSICYLAMLDGQARGIAGGYFPDDGTGPYLVSMWVESGVRRHGIGRRLVDAVFDWARSRGASRLLLDVTTTNDPAIRFYERLGFRRTGTIKPYPNDTALQECEMSKTIT